MLTLVKLVESAKCPQQISTRQVTNAAPRACTLPPPHQAPATPYPWRCSCSGRITVLNVEVDIDVIEQSFTE